MLCYDLGGDFVDHIAKTNASEFIQRVRSFTFWDRSDEGSIESWEYILESLEFSTIFQTSCFIISQTWWKKFIVNPYRPRDLPSAIWRTTYSTSRRVIDFINMSFFSWETREWMCWVICSMFLLFSIPVSVIMSHKRWLKTSSISSLVSTLYPLELFIDIILLCDLSWMTDIWKKFVFISPSLSHLILDF